MSDGRETFDYVIVGGGAAGCILANRLSARADRSVLLLEAGGEGRDLWISIPAGFGRLLRGAKFNWRFQTEPEPELYDRRIVVPRGKGLGGSTLINGMIYVRGQPLDFDVWAQMGATGWSFDDLLPYFKSLESFTDGDGGRGHAGPVSIERVSARHELPDAFIRAAVEAGYPANPDYNGEDQEGFGYYQTTQRNGRRWSAADAYLSPVRGRPNLTVRTHAHVTRIEFEGRRAVGVSYSHGGRTCRADARAETILAAGAVQSPQLLELSGVGDPEVLARVGIETRHKLVGVGANYIDHFATRMNWRVTRPITLNETSRGWRLGLAIAEYALFRRGILTLGTGLAHGFVRTSEDVATPDVQYFFMHASYADAGTRTLDRAPGMTIGVSQLRPQSRGSIHISSPDPHAPPAIRPNFLSAPADGRCMVAGMRIARRIVNGPAMDPYRAYEMSPGPDVETDEQWLEFARRNGQSIYHPVGTCRMGGDDGAVVDAHLKVRGLEALRVADASVMPTIVSANTQAAVMVIAEKAADLIAAERR